MKSEDSHVMSDGFLNVDHEDFNEVEYQVESPEHLQEIGTWCEQSCKGEWLVGWHFHAFYDPEDLVLFTLKWIS